MNADAIFCSTSPTSTASDQRRDAEDAACSSLSDESHAAAAQPAVVNEDRHLSDEIHESDTVCMPDDAVTAVDIAAASVLLDQISSSGVDNADTEKSADGDRPPASKPVAPEASGAVAAACGGTFDQLSGTDLDAMIARQQQLLDRIKAEQEEFINQIERAKAEIERAAETTYGAVDNCVNNLLASAAELKSERVAQLERSRSEMESTIASMNWHHMFVQELLKHGTPAELTYYAPRLHADAERILREQNPEVPQMTAEAEDKLAAFQAFAGLNIEELRRQAGGNLLGHVTHSEAVDTNLPDDISPYRDEPSLVATMVMDNGVCGVAFLDVNLFVVRDRSSVVEVYITSEGLVQSRQIDVEQMTCPTKIAACTIADCVFVSDSQVSGLFRIPSADVKVTLLPLDSIPSGLAVTADGCVIITLADTQVIQTVSAADGSITSQIHIGAVGRPISVVPVNGEDNGFVVCNNTVGGLEWFVCGHRLEAAARSLEEPIRLRSLRNISGLVPDPFGSYIAFSTAQNSIKLFDSTFALLRPLFRASESVERPTAMALNPTSGRVAIGQENGVIKLYQMLRTRETIEVGICNWT